MPAEIGNDASHLWRNSAHQPLKQAAVTGLWMQRQYHRAVIGADVANKDASIPDVRHICEVSDHLHPDAFRTVTAGLVDSPPADDIPA
jgi:hypothetical protein